MTVRPPFILFDVFIFTTQYGSFQVRQHRQRRQHEDEQAARVLPGIGETVIPVQDVLVDFDEMSSGKTGTTG